MELTGNNVRYSKGEKRVFSVLKSGRRLTTEDIAEKVYNAGRTRPFHARQAVLSTLNTLADKAKANREPFTVKRQERQGPHPIEFWIEPR